MTDCQIKQQQQQQSGLGLGLEITSKVRILGIRRFSSELGKWDLWA